jgi:hypothetical protein
MSVRGWLPGIAGAVVAVAGGVIWHMVYRADSSDPLAQAVSSYEHRNWRESVRRTRAILRIRPSDPRARRLLGRSSARLGRDESAEAIYRSLGTGFMEAEDLFLLGSGLLRRGRTGPALAALGAARDADPDHAETLDALVGHWHENHTLVDAAMAAERLMKQPGWEVRGAVWLGRLRREMRDPAGAAEMLARALKNEQGLRQSPVKSDELRKDLARCWLEAGKPAEARRQLRDVEASGQDSEAAWLMSRACLQEGRFLDAQAALARSAGYGHGNSMLEEPSPFVGSERCSVCHPAQFRAQQISRHARTLVRTSELRILPWPDVTIVDRDNPVVQHRFRAGKNQIEVAVAEAGNRVLSAVIEYALGSNHQGQTFLARDEHGNVRELRISRYPSEPRWDRTMEHPQVPPDSAGYLGRPISGESLRRCLDCHATNSRAVQAPDGRPEARDQGIGCERCHGPAGHHLQAVRGEFAELAIARPKLASAARVVALCGECHTAPSKTTPADAGFVRYQASSLILSRCYIESGEAVSCVTCHNPHKDAETSTPSYEARCLECHPSSRSSAPNSRIESSQTWCSCPVNPRSDCLACHMPRVKDAVPRAGFTDHWIRAHRDGVTKPGINTGGSPR